MQLRISHTTTYSYDRPVEYALQKLRLRPQRIIAQEVLEWSVEVTGGTIEASYTDQYGNHVDLVNVTRGVDAVTVRAQGIASTEDNNGVLGQVYGRAPLWHFRQSTLATTACDDIKGFASDLSDTKDTLSGLHTLSERVLAAVPYKTGETHSHTTAEEALRDGFGVCQDHAHIFIATARAAGLPARYVSGYLMMNDRIDQEATHAWAEVHVDALGWVGFDVSNGISPDARYVRVAVGRDARDAAPTEGLRQSDANEQLIVSLQVQQ